MGSLYSFYMGGHMTKSTVRSKCAAMHSNVQQCTVCSPQSAVFGQTNTQTNRYLDWYTNTNTNMNLGNLLELIQAFSKLLRAGIPGDLVIFQHRAHVGKIHN